MGFDIYGFWVQKLPFCEIFAPAIPFIQEACWCDRWVSERMSRQMELVPYRYHNPVLLGTQYFHFIRPVDLPEGGVLLPAIHVVIYG